MAALQSDHYTELSLYMYMAVLELCVAWFTCRHGHGQPRDRQGATRTRGRNENGQSERRAFMNTSTAVCHVLCVNCNTVSIVMM